MAVGVVLAVVVAALAAVAIVTAGGEEGPADTNGGPAGQAPAPTAGTTETDETPGATPSTEASPAASQTPPPLRRPTEKDPLRVYFGGDSLSGMPGMMFFQRAQKTGLMKVSLDYQVSSRLTVNDPIDWPARVRAQIGARRYDAAVFMIGINDTGMPMLVDGTSLMYPKKAWLGEYQDRVEDLMRIMLSSGAERVYWMGLPVMPGHDRTKAVSDLNDLFKAAAAKHPDVVYVDTFPVLATASGEFDPGLRVGDGVHFTNEGATLLADAVWQAMKDDWRAPAAVTDQAAP